ncbi:MAG TPA: hypothetical protein VMI94_09985 [Bryobacteraceae bacterium]|nr:hypothetical protein [Bryobacteraceae bacterium]
MRIISLLLLSSSLYAMSYQTTFPLTENPISEGGRWSNGAADGVDWCNVRTRLGEAFGVGPCPVEYADPTAILKGAWGPDQTVEAKARIRATNASYYQEIELRLRTTVSAHSITGYEINFGVSHAYLQIVRWNGPLADFTYLGSSCNYPAVCGQVNGFTIQNGDGAKAVIAGGTIRVYVNGALRATATDSTYPGGNPGIGFNFGCDGTYPDFGWESFAASDRGPAATGR